MKRINYSNSIVGIPNSILKYFGIEYFNSTSKVLDKYLNKKYFDEHSNGILILKIL